MTTSPLKHLWGDLAPIQPLEAWGTGEAPPKEFLIFKFGLNHATIGGRREVVTLTLKNAQKIVAEWKRRRISGAFDYEHAIRESNPTGTPAAGWFNLEVRNDGLWAVSITWTDRAINYFKAKEYRYFSPFFFANGKGEVTALLNIALTNWPATDQQRPLIALSWAMRRYTMSEFLSIEQLGAKAQELMDTFGAKGEMMDIVMWLDKFQRGGAVPVAEPIPGEEIVIEENAVPSEDTAVAQAAYTIFETKSPKEAIASMRQFKTVLRQRDEAQGELRQIKHSQAVDAALKAGKITPAQKEQALKDDPDEFRIAMKYANSVRDNDTLTPDTRISKTKAITAEELEKDENLIAYVNEQRAAGATQTVKDFARSWANRFPDVPFSK